LPSVSSGLFWDRRRLTQVPAAKLTLYS